MSDFDTFSASYEFETAVLAAVERDDTGAALEMLLAAGDFRRTVQRLPALPEDTRRRLAHDCVELYRAAEAPERRHGLLTVHAGLLGRRVDLLENDGFEDAALAAMHIGETADDEKRAVCETALASPEFPWLVERLRTLDSEFRRRLTENTLKRMPWDTADPERRARILWMHTVLSPRPDPLDYKAAGAAEAMLHEVVDNRIPASDAAQLEGRSLAWKAQYLVGLSRGVRRELVQTCVQVYEGAGTQERRDAALWAQALLSSPRLEHLGYAELEPMLRAAVERGDVAAACEMVLSDKKALSTAEKLSDLPTGVRRHLAEKCGELYESAASERRRKRILRVHAMLSMALGEPDDRLAAPRQEALRSSPHDIGWWLRLIEIAWVELAAGRDIPADVAAMMRHKSYDTHPLGAAGLRTVVPLLADRQPPINAGQPWSDRALAELADLPEAWTNLLKHAATATKPRPDAAWRKKGLALLAEVDEREFRGRALSWLSLAGDPRSTLPGFDNYNYAASRGLVWLLSFLPEAAETVRGLGTVLEKSLRKAPGIGPAMPKLANACANALCAMEGEAALAEIARLTTRVTYKSTLNLLSKGLDARAEALGLGRDEIAELAVPAYGLTEVGRRVADFGEARAELVVASGRAGLRWFNAAGKAVKSVPAAVRRDHPEELKELKAQVKDIGTMLSAVARRLDRQLLTDREWPAEAWRERYLDHPLVGTLARRLIWTVDGTACRYADGALRDLSGEPVALRGAVRLWHPVDHPVEDVMAWREHLERERITQPFKQAHREVYLLTDAERRTRTYSNRFAGHILRQHPFRSLAAERGWRDPQLRIAHHDCAYPPAMRDLPDWGMRAEYLVVGDSGQDLDSSPFLLLAADQVRFQPMDAPESSAEADAGGFGHAGTALPLEEIPARVLSEVLRDVDLFVGVTSVGNDPTWQDGGPGGRFREYWSSYSFGELSETARTRHDLLGRLLPRLAIGDRCRVEGRFLHVKGELHTYKIHLGSGNILMDPGDRYLCIVPDNVPAARSGTYLPFDGDRMLSLILSKALLLADDTKITDTTILSQIRPTA